MVIRIDNFSAWADVVFVKLHACEEAANFMMLRDRDIGRYDLCSSFLHHQIF
jgi:hypothetical protein